jgi:hypothetical protein
VTGIPRPSFDRKAIEAEIGRARSIRRFAPCGAWRSAPPRRRPFLNRSLKAARTTVNEALGYFASLLPDAGRGQASLLDKDQSSKYALESAAQHGLKKIVETLVSISIEMGPQICMQKGLCREFDDDCPDLCGTDKPRL